MTDSLVNRIDRIVSDLLKGRRLNLRSGDAEEKAAITAAARLVAARQGPQRMSPAFRQRLARVLANTPQRLWLTRRAALVAGLGVAAGALGGVLLGRTLEVPRTSPSAASKTINPIPGRWVEVAALVDLPEGQGVRVAAGAVGAYVFRRGQTVHAVSSLCSHLPCELDWRAGEGLLVCPCHQVTFTPEGQPTDRTYPLPGLHPVSVRVTAAGRVEVLGT